jgi:integrase
MGKGWVNGYFLGQVEGEKMTIKWIQSEQTGVRFYVHPTKKYREGKNGPYKKDRCYVIRYQAHGKRYEHVVGWASEKDPADGKHWNELKAATLRATLMGNAKNYQEEKTIADMRDSAKEKEEAKRAEAEHLEKENVTVAEYCEKTYFPWTKQNKADNTYRTEDLLFTHWVKPVIGAIPLVEVVQIDMERIKQAMFAAKKAPKTVHHTLGLVRQIYNHAKRPDIYLRAKVKMPKVDNAKLRYLTPAEIVKLLAALKEKSVIVHDQAILAVNCGLRFSEAAGLRWEDVNYDTGSLSIRDSKTGSRTVFLNDVVADMLKNRQGKKTTGLIFPEKRKVGTDNDQRQLRASKTFQRVADILFNKDVNDRRLRVTFHTLRHSFGTHVYENSGDLYLTQKALGHRTMVMAQRYAKMTETRLREAFTKMSDVMKKGREIAKEQAEQEQAAQDENVVNIAG